MADRPALVVTDEQRVRWAAIIARYIGAFNSFADTGSSEEVGEPEFDRDVCNVRDLSVFLAGKVAEDLEAQSRFEDVLTSGHN